MLSRFEEARAKPTLSASPSITSAVLPNPSLLKLSTQRLRLCFADVEAVEHDELALARLGGQRHLKSELTNLLVEARHEHPRAWTMSLAAADEDRSPAIAVTRSTAALLPSQLLARARNIAALASRPSRSAAIDKLPRDDAVKNVGAGLDGRKSRR